MVSSPRRESWGDLAAIAAINGYQRYLSPHKGFSCAHRVLHGGESCSQHIKQAIATKGLLAAVQLSKQRFADCKTAKLTLEASKKSKRRRQENTYDCVDIGLGCGELPSIGDCEDWGDGCGDSDCIPDLDSLDCSDCSGCEVGCGDFFG